MVVSFKVSADEIEVIQKVVDRAERINERCGVKVDRFCLAMDLAATHANGCPMDFRGLLTARDFDFSHDIAGISIYLDRTTGQLERCFVPRYRRLH